MPFRVTACDAGAEFALLTQRMPLKIVALKGGRSSLDGELLQIKPHLRGYFGRDIRIGDHLRDIAARHLVAAEAVIEDAEFKLQARSVGREDQHALQRGDGRLVIPDLRGERRIFESDVEIAWVLEHQPQQAWRRSSI